MKKFISLLLVAILSFSSLASAAPYETLYSLDGREISVLSRDAEIHKMAGWYSDKKDVERVTIYAPDAREIEVARIEVPAYKRIGWSDNLNDVLQTMYSIDGREIVIYKSEVEAYKKVGWYENKSDVMAVVCARDGRTMSIYKGEVQAYINVGWIPQQPDYIDPAKPMIALTFDDGPKSSTTGKVLDVMELYNVRCTFFVLGSLAENNASILKRMDSLGCQIGNHSYSHPDLTTLSSGGVSDELNKTSNIVYGAVGKYPSLVRPPYGSSNQTVLNATAKPFILWSIDTLDWKYRDATRVHSVVMSEVSDGDIILMHDIYTSTADAVESIVPDLILKGYQLVTVEELSYYKNKPLNAYKKYSSIR